MGNCCVQTDIIWKYERKRAHELWIEDEVKKKVLIFLWGWGAMRGNKNRRVKLFWKWTVGRMFESNFSKHIGKLILTASIALCGCDSTTDTLLYSLNALWPFKGWLRGHGAYLHKLLITEVSFGHYSVPNDLTEWSVTT